MRGSQQLRKRLQLARAPAGAIEPIDGRLGRALIGLQKSGRQMGDVCRARRAQPLEPIDEFIALLALAHHHGRQLPVALQRPRHGSLCLRQVQAIAAVVFADGLAFHEAQPALTKTRPRGRPPRRVGHNLLLRLSTYQKDVLRFLTDPRVPFTNNLAERDGRMMKLRQKISGGFRSEDGAKDFAVIRSVLSTARKQGWHIIATLTADPDSLLAQLRAD